MSEYHGFDRSFDPMPQRCFWGDGGELMCFVPTCRFSFSGRLLIKSHTTPHTGSCTCGSGSYPRSPSTRQPQWEAASSTRPCSRRTTCTFRGCAVCAVHKAPRRGKIGPSPFRASHRPHPHAAPRRQQGQDGGAVRGGGQALPPRARIPEGALPPVGFPPLLAHTGSHTTTRLTQPSRFQNS